MKKLIKGVGVVLLILVVVYLLGPEPEPLDLSRELPKVADNHLQIIQDLKNREKAEGVRPGNEAEVVWANSSWTTKTPICVVYLHGFSASKVEGEPIHREFAKRYGCNLYLPRLAAHGLEGTDPFLAFSAEKVVESAKEAIAIGKQLGEKVLLMTCSTGGTLGLYLAGDDPDVLGLINYSPNVAMAPWNSFMLNNPWGLQIARLVIGDDYYHSNYTGEAARFWYQKYRLEALVQLQQLVEATMTDETFALMNRPFFMGYYFKDEEHKDPIVSVDAMRDMFEKIGTPQDQKRAIAFPDAEAHVINSPYRSKALDKVRKETFKFAEEVLKMRPRL